MQQTIDPRYTFFFVGSDVRSDPAFPPERRYSRQLYWDSLYAFSHKDETILGAARVVPYSDVQYALYLALKRRDRNPISQQLLPETSHKPLLGAPKEDESTDLVARITEVLPDRPSSIPQDVIAESEKRLEEAISSAMMSYGLETGLDQFSDPGGVQSMERRFEDPADALHILADVKGEDVAWLNLSFQVDAAIKRQLRENLEANVSEDTLALYSDFEDDLSRKLYSNPKYLEFVKRVMDVKGGYLSPVVRDFLSFYSRCLSEKLSKYAQQEHVDPDIMSKRLESLLGSEKEDLQYYVRDHHDLTILGCVDRGHVPEDQDDPDRTGHSFKVDPDIDLGGIVLREITGKLQRFLIKTFVRYTFNEHHNIKSIQYVDEV